MFSKGSLVGGRYKLQKHLGSGAMGSVWLALDERLGRSVALKCIAPLMTLKASAVEVLKDEAKTGAKLIGHPNIVCTLDLCFETSTTEEDFHYIVIEYANGRNLETWISRDIKKLDPETRKNLGFYISLQVCNAIGYAHYVGIIHRDIKPSNIFLPKQGLTKVGDFGLARIISSDARKHTVGQYNTPAYAAPEQWDEEEATDSTDIYQLECTLYELLTGRLPFLATSQLKLMKAHLEEMPPTPASINPLLPSDVSSILLKCLAKDPDDRPPLWQVSDTFAKQIRCLHWMTIDFTNSTESERESIIRITDAEVSDLKDPEFTVQFEDFSECYSEMISLVLLDIYRCTIDKESIS